MRIRFFAISPLLLAACAVETGSLEAVGQSEGSVTIGAGELVPVAEDGGNIPAQYRDLLDAVGMLEPVGCTAVHVGDGIVLTAGHCLGAATDECSDFDVRWGVRGERAGTTSACTKILAFQHDLDMDYAVLRVAPVPAAAVPADACDDPEPGTAITVLSHPQRQPLAWSNVCMIEPAAEAHRGTGEFSHACDTEHGSSGAPVFDDTTLRVVGIHAGGEGQWNYGTFVSAIPFFAPARAQCACGRDSGESQSP